MDKKEICPFKKGDILRNDWAGDENPVKYTMFLKCGLMRHGRSTTKTYDCIGYDGTKVQFYRHDHQLVKVGRIGEFEVFLKALKKMKGWGKNESQDQ